MLAVDDRTNPADPDIILERQYRHAAGQYLIELPAGSRDPGELPPSPPPSASSSKRPASAPKSGPSSSATSPAPASSASGCRSTSPATSAKATSATPELDEQIEIIRMPLPKNRLAHD